MTVPYSTPSQAEGDREDDERVSPPPAQAAQIERTTPSQAEGEAEEQEEEVRADQGSAR